MSSAPTTLYAGITNNTQIPPGWNLNGYFFDAWLRMEQVSNLTLTQHPVQSGAAITDHAFIMPFIFSFEIGISDTAQSVRSGQYTSNPTKSVDAYKKLKALQAKRELCFVTTKYGTYNNILVKELRTADDYKTQNNLYATFQLEQINIANATLLKASGLPSVTEQLERGQVTGKSVPESTLHKLGL